MIRTLICIPNWITIPESTIACIDSIRNTLEAVPYIFSPTSDNSYSFHANQGIEVAKHLGCDYILLLDNDITFEMKGWLDKLESALDRNPSYALLLQGDLSDPSQTDPVYADETAGTPYTIFAYAFYRLSAGIWFDEDYLFCQSSDVDFVRELRRQGYKTGTLPCVTVNHHRRADTTGDRDPHYIRYKERNERLFNMKWGGAICHHEPTPEQWALRCNWRGVKHWNMKDVVPGQDPIDNLKDVSKQCRTIEGYRDSRLYENDQQLIKTHEEFRRYYRDVI